jgi:AraC-like DNA-binding protein
MSTTASALDEPAAAGRLDYWHEILRQTAPIALHGRLDEGADLAFDARIRAGELGPVKVTEVTVPSGECVRTPQLIRHADPEVYSVDIVSRGRVMVEHNGHRADLAAGDFTLIDSSRPARFVHTALRYVAITFPRALLPLRTDEANRLAGRRFGGGRGSGGLVSSFARQLPGHLDDCRPAAGARLGTAVIDLVSAALATDLGGAAGLSGESSGDLPGDPSGDLAGELPGAWRRRALLAHIYAFIEQRLADPELSPAAIAAAHHISVRYLHKLFEGERTTVADRIRRRRLERCRRDLRDPALRARSVGAIAARWGFTNPAHFNRLFRSAYDMPPGEYRGRALRALA